MAPLARLPPHPPFVCVQEPVWASFMQRLPKEPPQEPLSHSALIEAIVRIYVRQVRREGLLGPGEGKEGKAPRC